MEDANWINVFEEFINAESYDSSKRDDVAQASQE